MLRHTPTPDEKDGQIRHGSYLPDHFVKLEEEKWHATAAATPRSRDSPSRVSSRYTTPRNAHYPIELSATIASWDGDMLTVHDTTRWITRERVALAAYLGLPEENVRMISPLVGGAFGSKSFLWMHVVLCAVAARAVDASVKLVLTRNQMFSSTGRTGRAPIKDATLIADQSAHLASTEHHTVTETSTVAHFCEPTGLSTRFLYQSGCMIVSHRVARINAPTPCFMRGPGEAPGLFALEVAMDELAHESGLDPLEMRTRNHVAFDQASGKPWSGKHLLDCYTLGAERFGWDKRPLVPRSLPDRDVQVGWGMAHGETYPGRRTPASCRVVTDDDGQVRFASATHEIGTGVRTAVMGQVVADACGLPLTQVTFESGDSSFPQAPYSGASQTTATVGSAVFAAAAEWKRRILALLTADPATPFHGLDPAQLTIADGAVQTIGAETCAPLTELLAKTSYRQHLSFTVAVDAGEQQRSGVSQSFGAHSAKSRSTNRSVAPPVTRWVAVMDCGRVVNPETGPQPGDGRYHVRSRDGVDGTRS